VLVLGFRFWVIVSICVRVSGRFGDRVRIRVRFIFKFRVSVREYG